MTLERADLEADGAAARPRTAVPPSTERVYFRGLNGLRFVAAFAVIIHHVEQFKMWVHLPNAFRNPVVWSFGGQGVALFFVLSGFLITYLLLTEVDRFGDVSIRKFYVRRVLRIFPLYYLTILFALGIAPVWMAGMGGAVGSLQDGLFDQTRTHLPELVLLNAFMLPNLANVLYPPVLFASQAWSIGSEEQFYLLWPWVFRLFARRLLLALALVVLLKIGLTHWIAWAGPAGLIPAELADGLLRFGKLLRLEFMGIGGIGAYFLYRHRSLVERCLGRGWLEPVGLVALLALLGSGAYVAHELLAIGYTAVLLIVCVNERLGRRLDRRWLNHLGKLSYGIYMFHPLTIMLSLWLTQQTLGFDDFTAERHALVFALSLIGSIVVAEVSYRYFERFFLQKKDRFTRVGSMSTGLDEEDLGARDRPRHPVA